MLPLPLLGIPDGFDTPEHLRFVQTYMDAMASGTLMPGWAAGDNFGFGSVGVRFYPPLAHYVMAVVQLFTDDWFDTIWITSFFWMIVGATGVYRWAREFLSPKQSALVSILFVAMPYHLMQLYNYMLLAEFAAIAILPYCFLFATRLIRNAAPIDTILLAVSCSLFVLTHLPSIIVGFITLSIYCLFLIDWSQFRRTFINFAVAFLITLAASAFYLSRLFTEIDWVKHNDPQFFASSIYDYRQYLFPMFLNPEKPFWKKMVMLVDIPVFLTFLFLLPPFLCLALKVVRKNADKKLLAALSAAGAFLIFILSYPSVVVWDSMVLLQRIQFPFRFLSAACVIASLSTVFSLSLLFENYPKFKRLVGYSALAVCLATVLFNITQVIIPSEADSRTAFSKKIEQTQNEPACRCWWPTWANAGAFNGRERIAAGDRSIAISEWAPEVRSFSVAAGDVGEARVATFWYPYWQASVNGRKVDLGRDESGAMLIELPSERADVVINFHEPLFLLVARYTSVLIWFGLLAALVLLWRSQQRSQSQYGVSPVYADCLPDPDLIK
jgi:hypothetical protein